MMEVESNIEVARGTSGASKEMEKGGGGGRHNGWGESQQAAAMGLGGESGGRGGDCTFGMGRGG